MNKHKLYRKCCEIYCEAWEGTTRDPKQIAKFDRIIFPSFEPIDQSKPRISLEEVMKIKFPNENDFGKRQYEADLKVQELLNQNNFDSWPEEDKYDFIYQLQFFAV